MWGLPSRGGSPHTTPRFTLDRLTESASGIMRGLLTLQINTIEKEGMTGGPVPPLPHALLDLAGDYLDVLQQQARVHFRQPGDDTAQRLLAGELRPEELAGDAYETLGVEALFPALRPAGPDPGGLALRLTPAAFHVLRQAAAWALANPPPETPPEAAVLRRILENSDAIKTILKRDRARAAWQRGAKAPPYGQSRAELRDNAGLIDAWYEVSPSDALVIRHAWEIGTETILAQTVVQLRGDIVTRLHPRPKHPETLRAMHQLGIDSALGHWHMLFGFVAQLARDLLGKGGGGR